MPQRLPTDPLAQYTELRRAGLPPVMAAGVAGDCRAAAASLALAMSGEAVAAAETVTPAAARNPGFALVLLGITELALREVLDGHPQLLDDLAQRMREQALVWSIVAEHARSDATEEP